MSLKKVFTEEESLKESEDYFGGNNKLAAKVFHKYALKNNQGDLLECTPRDMHNRIARELARIERDKFREPLTHEQIFSYLDGFNKIIPQGGMMFGIGNPYQYTSIANCITVPPPYDSYGGIFFTDQCIVQTSKRRMGVGCDVSSLRPRGSVTKNAAGSSTGAISFAKRYANSIFEVAQHGRRGSAMLLMSVHHPDIIDFIHMKEDLSQATATNISVKITGEFMQAVREDKDYEQRYPVDSKTPQFSSFVNARKVWRDLVRCAWNTGDPGLLLWDNIIRESIPDCYGEKWQTSCTNVCGEIPLNPLGACVLFAINGFTYVNSPFTSSASFNWREFYEDVQVAQRLIDNTIDIEIERIDAIIAKIKKDPEPEYIKYYEKLMWEKIKEIHQEGRRIGLTIVGMADVLAALELPYISEKSSSFIDRLYKTLKFGAYRSSVELAKEVGPFPIWEWEKEKDNPFLQRIRGETLDLGDGEIIDGYDLYHDMEEYGRRNICCLTSSPTGSVSIEAQTSSGIEPVPFLSIKRKLKLTEGMLVSEEEREKIEVDVDGNKFTSFIMEHPKLKKWREVTGKEDEKESPWFNSCAHDIDPLERIKFQSIIGKHIDQSLSNTVNLPKTATQKLVGEVFELAYDLGLKGITVYRDGSRAGIITDSRKESLDKSIEESIIKTEAPKRPRELPCDVHHVSIKGNKYFVLVGLYGKDRTPYEVFAGLNNFLPKDLKEGVIIKKRKGYYIASFPEHDMDISPIMASASEMEICVTRLISTSLRHGADIFYIVKQLEKIGEHTELQSFSRALARVLHKYIEPDRKEEGEECPQCKEQAIIRKEGCSTCCVCGWSKCL